jgi:hypothetical protein
MPSEITPVFTSFDRIRELAGQGDGTVCLANCTSETFIIVRAKGTGRLRTAALLVGTGQADGAGFYRLCEPGWRAALGPGQALALQARSGPCAGQALFSLQDDAGKALASLAYAMGLEPGVGPVRGELSLLAQAPGAADLLLAAHGPMPGGVFLVREAQLPVLREALEGVRKGDG